MDNLPLKVLSIDIGIVNLGYVYSEITFPTEFESNKYKSLLKNERYNYHTAKKSIEIIDCNRINITLMKHRKVSMDCCKLHHESCIPDYLDHFVQEYSDFFESCDILLLERQPPVGITNVQDLLFTKFRHKVILVSPNTVHKYFSLNSNYSIRKTESEHIASGYLINFTKFSKNNRKHDMSDALLMVLYFYKTKLDSLIKETVFKNATDLDFDKFKFTG